MAFTAQERLGSVAITAAAGWGRIGCSRSRFLPLDGIAYNTGVTASRVVIDTNVMVAALRSRRGASFQLVSLIGAGKFEISVSVPLVLEYEDALLRHASQPITKRDVGDLLDYVCSVADHQTIFYLWRPQLRDPKDDLVLEVAVAAGCDGIVTFNRRDFAGVEQFGLHAMTPGEFLRQIGEA